MSLDRNDDDIPAAMFSVKPFHQVPNDTNQTSALASALARKETRVVNILRACVLAVLILITLVVSAGVYIYTHNQEEASFERNFEDNANQVIESFHEAVERNMAAAASLSHSITSYALDSNNSFPFVTLPNFEVHGSDARVHGGSHLIHYAPLVTDEKRDEWEEYAGQNRFRATESFQAETQYSTAQDAEFGYSTRSLRTTDSRELQRPQGTRPTVLDDGTGYKPHIWSHGATIPAGDIPAGRGHYLPVWQQR